MSAAENGKSQMALISLLSLATWYESRSFRQSSKLHSLIRKPQHQTIIKTQLKEFCII